jgi:hypothetical protein
MARAERRSPDEGILRQVVRNHEHSRETKGARVVQCYVSDRFLSFSESSDLLGDGSDLMFVDVMTRDVDGDVRKLCELILDRRAVLSAVAVVKSRPFKPRTPPPKDA